MSSSYIPHEVWASLEHSGIKGMKWGYTKGKKNGNRTAAENGSEKEVLKNPNEMIQEDAAALSYEAAKKAYTEALSRYNVLKKSKVISEWDEERNRTIYMYQIPGFSGGVSSTDKKALVDVRERELNRAETALNEAKRALKGHKEVYGDKR